MVSHDPTVKDERYCNCAECKRIASQTVYAEPMENKSDPFEEFKKFTSAVGARLMELIPQVYANEMENKIMTRDEAHNQLTQRGHTPHTAKTLISDLEALGLLKFDEPVKPKAEDIVKRARNYLIQTEKTSPFPPSLTIVAVKELLDIIDNKYDDIKTVRIGKVYDVEITTGTGTYKAYGNVHKIDWMQ